MSLTKSTSSHVELDANPKSQNNIKPTNHKPLIEMENVVKIYHTQAGDFPALKGVSAHFYPGQFVSIIGKSGSGKSTMLNMITGIDRPTSGKILIDGTYLQDLTESQFSEWRGRNLGIVFQFFQLLPMLSLLENTILPMDFCNMYEPVEREVRAKKLLETVGLKNFTHQPPAAVSSGQEQCAAIARALANDPPIIVADEPTGNLDSKTADLVLNLLDDLVSRGKTILVVTHDEAVARRASRTLVICDGELVDETVSNAFPSISHRSMLQISHKVIALSKQPGDLICAENNVIPGLLIIEDGNLILQSQKGKELKSYEPGEVLTSKNIGEYRTSGYKILAGNHSPLRIKVVPQEDFQPVHDSSKRVQEIIAKLNETRFHLNQKLKVDNLQ